MQPCFMRFPRDMRAFYSDQFVLPLPPGHRFPMAKYRMLRDRIAQQLPGVALQVALPQLLTHLGRGRGKGQTLDTGG